VVAIGNSCDGGGGELFSRRVLREKRVERSGLLTAFLPGEGDELEE
jgi:hypothetical protein